MKKLILLISCFFLIKAYGQKQPAKVLENPDNIQVKKLDVLNSEHRETNLSITPDGRYLYFMSSRGKQAWSSKDFITFKGKTEYDGDIWYSRKGKGEWQFPKSLGKMVNTGKFEDEPVIFPDGQTVYYQSFSDGWRLDGGPYYKTTLRGDEWAPSKGVGGGINLFFATKNYSTDGSAISPDGRTFLIATGNVEYSQEMDIYVSLLNIDAGQWGVPEKLPFNTSGDERSVFIAGDGRTIYFASDGYEGFGGLDIFKTVIQNDGSFTAPVNIGKPFNTEEDDYGFIITAFGDEAYFIRDGDIYSCDLELAGAELKPRPTVVVTGRVQNEDKTPVQVEIQLIEVETNKVKATARSNALTGEYAMAVPNEGNTYNQVFKSTIHGTVTKEIKLDPGDVAMTVNSDVDMPTDPKANIFLTSVESGVLMIPFDGAAGNVRSIEGGGDAGELAAKGVNVATGANGEGDATANPNAATDANNPASRGISYRYDFYDLSTNPRWWREHQGTADVGDLAGTRGEDEDTGESLGEKVFKAPNPANTGGDISVRSVSTPDNASIASTNKRYGEEDEDFTPINKKDPYVKNRSFYNFPSNPMWRKQEGDAINWEERLNSAKAIELEDSPVVILFDAKSSNVKAKYENLLNSVAAGAKNNGDWILEVKGHTDKDGDARSNADLAMDRSREISRKLMELGVKGSQMRLISLGELKPVSLNTSASEKARNRRVEIHIRSKEVQVVH